MSGRICSPDIMSCCRDLFLLTRLVFCSHVRNKLFPREKQTVSSRETKSFHMRNKTETNVKSDRFTREPAIPDRCLLIIGVR